MSSSRHLGHDEPPLNRDGDLELPDDLERVADCLRREADQLACRAAPHAARRELLERLPVRPRRIWVWPAAVAAGLAVVFCGWQLHRSTVPPPAVPANADPSSLAGLQSAADPAPADVPPNDESRVVSSLVGAWDPATNSAAALGPISDAERIEMLERALEAYRAAILAQQDRLRETESRLREVEQELARWKEAAGR